MHVAIPLIMFLPHLFFIFMLFVMLSMQIIAAFLGGAAAGYVNEGFSNITSPALGDNHTEMAAVSAEFIFSFALVTTVLNVATSEKVAGNSYFGMAIGFIVLAGIVAVGDISGGCFNPAVAIALPIITNKHPGDVWVFLVGEFAGGVFGALVYTLWGNELRNSRKYREDRHDSRLINPTSLDDLHISLMGGNQEGTYRPPV